MQVSKFFASMLSRFELAVNLLFFSLTFRIREAFPPNHSYSGMIIGRTKTTMDCMKNFKPASLCSKAFFFHERLCQLSPIRVMKVVRLELGLVKDFLRDAEIGKNLHVIFLFRDPRSVFHSRWDKKKTGWCSRECASAKVYCGDLYNQYYKYYDLSKEFPGQLHMLRFEDFAQDPSGEVGRFFDEMGIAITKEVKEFIKLHTTKETKGENTVRDSKTKIIPWARSEWFRKSKLLSVQKSCNKAMSLFGYDLIESDGDVTVERAIKPFNTSNSFTLRRHTIS